MKSSLSIFLIQCSKTKKTAISGFQGKINKKNELLRI
jgi:hypothetical protein